MKPSYQLFRQMLWYCLSSLLVAAFLIASNPVFADLPSSPTIKPELVVQVGHTNTVEIAAFSPDGKTVVTASNDGSTKLWDAKTGALLHTLTGHTDHVDPAGDTTDIMTWFMFKGHNFFVASASFSPDGKTIITTNDDNTAKLWDAQTGTLRHTLTEHTNRVTPTSFSPDGKTVVTSYDDTAKMWDITTGALLKTFAGNEGYVRSASFGPDGKTIVTSSDTTAEIWDSQTGTIRHIFSADSASFSPDGKTIVTTSDDKTAKVWDVVTGALRHTLTGHTACVRSASFGPDGKTIVTASDDKTAKIWDVVTGALRHTLTGHTDSIRDASFSPDSKTIVTTSDDKTANLWDVATGALWHTLSGESAAFSPDGKTVVTSYGETAKIWDVATGALLRTLSGHTNYINTAAFSPDGKTVATASWDKTVKIWDVATGTLLRTLSGHTSYINTAAFSPDGKTVVTASDDCSTRFWHADTGAELCAVYTFDNDDWVVVTPDNHIDGTPGGLAQLHWVVGLTPIDLGQLKDDYLEPGLLGKVLRGEPLRQVPTFDLSKLFPDVTLPDAVPVDGKLTIHLTNQGGGIGPVEVQINGKQFTSDARDTALSQSRGIAKADVTVDLNQARNLIDGKPNQVTVIAYNSAGRRGEGVSLYPDAPIIRGRGCNAVYVPPTRGEQAPSQVWAIVSGINDYASPNLHLRFGVNDAERVAKSLEIGAGDMLGDKSRVHVKLLTSDLKTATRFVGDASVECGPASRAGLEQAFTVWARQAKPQDLLVVYLAGHGASIPDQGSLYCYLTQDAADGTTDALENPDRRAATAITSKEILEWVSAKNIAANKQVMILDTCSAGAFQMAMANGNRSDTGNQVRALDSFRDHSGFWVLMGCADKESSQESEVDGDGILTYSLLEYMHHGLPTSGEVDTDGMLDYAAAHVPDLMRDAGIDASQQPQTFKPADAQSFPLGHLTDVERGEIPWTAKRALVERPALFAATDDIGLEQLLIGKLEDLSASGVRGAGASPIALIDTDTPGAIVPRGEYTVMDSTITVTLTLRRNGQTLQTMHESGTITDKDALAGRLAADVERGVK